MPQTWTPASFFEDFTARDGRPVPRVPSDVDLPARVAASDHAADESHLDSAIFHFLLMQRVRQWMRGRVDGASEPADGSGFPVNRKRLARLLGVEYNVVQRALAGSGPISVELAIRLAKIVGRDDAFPGLDAIHQVRVGSTELPGGAPAKSVLSDGMVAPMATELDPILAAAARRLVPAAMRLTAPLMDEEGILKPPKCDFTIAWTDREAVWMCGFWCGNRKTELDVLLPRQYTEVFKRGWAEIDGHVVLDILGYDSEDRPTTAFVFDIDDEDADFCVRNATISWSGDRASVTVDRDTRNPQFVKS